MKPYKATIENQRRALQNHSLLKYSVCELRVSVCYAKPWNVARDAHELIHYVNEIAV
jgi:hypothetical protein